MFNTYDLTEFGKELRIIRQKCGLSQADIKLRSGINEDTMRRIENGLVIPKYETLEILSSLYKRDLLVLLQAYRTDTYYHNYYSMLDNILAKNQIHLIDELVAQFEENLSNKVLSQHLINKSELEQFNLFLTGIKQYNSTEPSEQRNAETTIKNSLRISIPDFEVPEFARFKYNYLEIRMLFLLGLIEEKICKIAISNEILFFVIDYLISDHNNIEFQKIVIKGYCNISYNYHRLDKHDLALKYADAGIDYAIHNHNMSNLYFLYARKGVAEYFLHHGNHTNSLSKCLHLLEIYNQLDLAKLYRKIMLDKYGIEL